MSEYRRAVAAAEERLARPPVPVQRVATSAGTVEVAVDGAGPSVLVVHGSGGGWDQGLDWARRRLPAGRRTLAVSRFGYLGSPLPAGATTSHQADAFAAVLDAVGLDRVDVVALSAGSVTAVRFAVERPDRVRSLLLESPLLPTRRRRALPPVPMVRLLARSQRLVWALTSSRLLVGLAAGVRWADLSPDQREELAAVNATLLPLAPRAAGLVFDRAVAAPEMLEDRLPVEQVTAPTLLVNARAAVLATSAEASAFVGRLPRGRLVELDAGGHVLVGNVERLRTVVARFLADPTAPAP